MWAPPAASPTGAFPSLRPSRTAVVRVLVTLPAAARPQDQPRRRLCLAVPRPAPEMASAAAEGEGEEEDVVVVEGDTGKKTAVEMDATVRRELAIRRLREEAEEEANEAGTRRRSSRRDFAVFETARGDALFTQSWTPAADDRLKGVVILLHGLNEHSGRYSHFAKLLNDQGLKVYAMDWIGHGGSDGVHGYVSSLDHAVGDLKEFLEDVVLEENHGLPCFLFGHSTGGAIVLKAALDPSVELHVEGVVLTSPAIHVQPSHPIIKVVAPIFSMLAPKYRVSALHKRGPPVSRDPEALKMKYSDPLVYTGPIRVRTGNEILRISSFLQRNLSRVTVPFLVLHGTADTITDPRASERLYQTSMSTNKSIKLYDGYLHDLLFEPERDDIANDIINWLSARLSVLQRW
ncbi:monoacylglycerol lipase [Zea mays]|uniref:Alpha/beta-Hydrolases superfamily protein n=2 Tax=Zea mays TaxID=4577 RepID=A0A1D6I3V3_MAIZE|nr:monoacylglycerol lipase [Zea mays]ONM54820.1 alpha/beta-Hydrolases superfamily protein [Zea mays]|eukprot:XP_008652678.1 uncharacterized protein LOC103632711 [Zea mays]